MNHQYPVINIDEGGRRKQIKNHSAYVIKKKHIPEKVEKPIMNNRFERRWGSNRGNG